MKLVVPFFLLFLAPWFICCSANSNDSRQDQVAQQDDQPNDVNSSVEVTNVGVSGSENAYIFNVTLKSSDTGCDQYANWWEVLDTNGNLIYRRILDHSHVNEQPFTRSGGSVNISEDMEVYIRGHMNNSGYGSKVFKGSVANGFSQHELDKTFAEDLENSDPLPKFCAF